MTRRLLLATLVALPVTASAQGGPNTLAPPPPGKLVDLGGYKLHLLCSGHGSPTVVIVPGAGEFSFDWALVQPGVAKVTRVCACDRGGAAWSDLGPAPRTQTQEAVNVWRTLQAAGEPGPYVLVGHSAGGPVVRFIAHDHPKDVVGMVLVDAGLPEGLTNINGHVGTTISFSRGRPIPVPRESLAADDRLTDVGVARIRAALAQSGWRSTIDPPFDKLPAREQGWQLWAQAQPKQFVSMTSDYIGEEAERLQAQASESPHPLGDIPLTVLVRDTTVEPAHTPGHVTLESKTAQLSSRGEWHVVPGAGHHIHLDQPRAVVDAIVRVVEEARKPKRTAAGH